MMNYEGNTIDASEGDDYIAAGMAGDTVQGGAGNDQYYLDGSEDIVGEAPDQGSDTIYTPVDYSLPDNVENLASRNAYEPLHLTGNALDNVITGSEFSNGNILDGGAGADTLISPDGGGTFYIDNPAMQSSRARQMSTTPMRPSTCSAPSIGSCPTPTIAP